MSSGTTVVIIVLVVLVLIAIGLISMTTRRRHLQERFGAEYDRAVGGQDSRLRAEAELAERQRRVRRLDIQPLPEPARRRYESEWQTVQEKFVDSPELAVAEAYTLVTAVMRERGYPISDDDQIMADLSVDHSDTVGHFRSAQEITRSAAAGDAATEDLRQALIHYRALFADLLDDPALADGGMSGTRLNGSGKYQTAPAAHRNGGVPADTDPDGTADPYLESDNPSQPQGR